MLKHNKKIMEYLKGHGIECKAKRIDKGSMKGNWLLYNPTITWSQELADKFNILGFLDFEYKPLGIYSGNGGAFFIYVRKED